MSLNSLLYNPVKLPPGWYNDYHLPENYYHLDFASIAVPVRPTLPEHRSYQSADPFVRFRRGRPPEVYETAYEIRGNVDPGDVQDAVETLRKAHLVPVKLDKSSADEYTAPVPAFVDVWETFHHMGTAEHMTFLEILAKKAPISIRDAYLKRLTADCAVEQIFGDDPH